MILVIDNYDSFTYNLVQALQASGANVRVVRNDDLDRAAIEQMAAAADEDLNGILISPGPGDPSTSGASLDAIAVASERRIPLFGVCLGMQALGHFFGASIVRAPTLVHGESSIISHDHKGLFADLPWKFPAARYHSLCVDAATVPPELHVSAIADDGVVMGLRHKTLPLEGVQFHPESVLTPAGPRLIAAFLRVTGEGDPDRLDRVANFAMTGIAPALIGASAETAAAVGAGTSVDRGKPDGAGTPVSAEAAAAVGRGTPVTRPGSVRGLGA
ncbi:MAG: aminodeoxychorismate/anthranilate synthase component II [Candidatus Limnocylindrales bacterium]